MDFFWNLTLHTLLTLSLSAVSIGWYQGCTSRGMKVLALTPILVLGTLYILSAAADTPGEYLFHVSSGAAGAFVIGTALLWLWRERLLSWRVSAVVAMCLLAVHLLSSQVLQLKLDALLSRHQGDAAETIHELLPPRAQHDDNAAPIYSRLATQVSGFDFDALSKHTPTDGSLALLESSAPLLEELRRAVQLPVCSFESTNGYVRVNALGLVRLGNGLNQAAHIARDAGNRALAFEYIRAQLDLAEHLCQTPLLFLAKAASSMRLNAVETIATLGPNPEEMPVLTNAWTKLTDQQLSMLRLEEAAIIRVMVHHREHQNLASDYLGLKSMARDARVIQEYSDYRSSMRELQKLAKAGRIHEIEAVAGALFSDNQFVPKSLGIRAALHQWLAECDQRLEPYQASAASSPR